jgi:hypothetical protein
MLISVINLSKLEDSEVQKVIRAVNRQIREDFEPAWNSGGTLRLEGHSLESPSRRRLPDMRGDAVLYLWDKTDVKEALGYHAKNFRGVPYGIVSVELADAIKEPWSMTFSHEALELIADPLCNLLVEGPHPSAESRHERVFRWYEVCDPVQSESYEIDGQVVSNFVLPLYFTEDDEKSGRNAFHHHPKHKLQSFGTNPGGYVGYYDPRAGRHDTWAPEDDKRAHHILDAKSNVAPIGRTVRRVRNHAAVKEAGAE